MDSWGMPLARWPSRILAWLVDAVIVSVAMTILSTLVSLPVVIPGDPMASEAILASLAFFAYCVVMESQAGRTVGKMLLNLRVVDIRGGVPGIEGILLSCFGKSFLLPVDVAIGWLVARDSRQRAFGRLGGVVVVRTKSPTY